MASFMAACSLGKPELLSDLQGNFPDGTKLGAYQDVGLAVERAALCQQTPDPGRGIGIVQ
jgi:hypothetical protein